MRERLQRDVRDIQATFGLCVVYVTHELRDACAMGDRMAVIGDGRIEQVGEPLDVIRHPASYDVARFVGMRNLFEGEVDGVDGGVALVRVGGLTLRARMNPLVKGASQVYVCVRPEDFRVVRAADPTRDPNAIAIKIRDRVLRGATITLSGEAIEAGGETVEAGGEIHVELELGIRAYEVLDLAARQEVTVTAPVRALHLIERTAGHPAPTATRPVTTAAPKSS